MMNKRNLFLILPVTVILLVFSCKPAQAPINIINLNKAQGLRDYSNVYFLPKTVIRVKVTAERENYVKGPYYQYASSYLNLNDVIMEDRHKWRISAVEFSAYPIADTNNVYLIEINGPQSLPRFCYNKNGFLQSINAGEVNINEETEKNESEEISGKVINLPASNFELQSQKKISFDDVPLPKDIVLKKVVSEQASALANKILMLRDDRAALLVGDGYTQALPVGETMKTMIEQIDKTLESYTSMFVGKTLTESFTYQFDFIPDEPRKRTQSILFRFSDQRGVVDNTDLNGIPVIIEIESYENLKQLEQFKKRQFYLENVGGKNETEKGFYYRIPEMGVVRLIKNERILQEEKIQVAQFGSVQYLPFKYFGNNYSIRFYPEIGAIKSISKYGKQEQSEKKNKSK